jgi:Raf kinase inhibitor-like YbhB/YbcL family protein
MGLAAVYPAAAQSPGYEIVVGKASLKLESAAFTHNGDMPARFTCDGAETPPPLAWSGLPNATKSLALIVEDPDVPDPKAPKYTFVHWVLYNLPPTVGGMAEGMQTLPPGTLEALNNTKHTGYKGPCPPIGKHRYIHKLYALDTVLPDLNKPNKAQLEQAMAGHVLAETALIGLYERTR